MTPSTLRNRETTFGRCVGDWAMIQSRRRQWLHPTARLLRGLEAPA